MRWPGKNCRAGADRAPGRFTRPLPFFHTQPVSVRFQPVTCHVDWFHHRWHRSCSDQRHRHPQGGPRSRQRRCPGGAAGRRVSRPESDGYARRVEARRAAEDARLERFRADDLPLPAARALSAFASVAAVGDDSETASGLAGIDITV